MKTMMGRGDPIKNASPKNSRISAWDSLEVSGQKLLLNLLYCTWLHPTIGSLIMGEGHSDGMQLERGDFL
jgi:hypothetical protein